MVYVTLRVVLSQRIVRQFGQVHDSVEAGQILFPDVSDVGIEAQRGICGRPGLHRPAVPIKIRCPSPDHCSARDPARNRSESWGTE